MKYLSVNVRRKYFFKFLYVSHMVGSQDFNVQGKEIFGYIYICILIAAVCEKLCFLQYLFMGPSC